MSITTIPVDVECRHNRRLNKGYFVSQIILHHYDQSPYAEKIRILLGYKKLTWSSAIAPRIMPKPDLIALTGGYRKIPVMQIGADIFCDTHVIAWELDRSAPQPSIIPVAGSWAEVVEHWVDTYLFWRAVAYTFGRNADVLPDALLADRGAMRDTPFSRDALKQGVPQAAQELAGALAWLETALYGTRAFINGDYPAAADFTLYSTLWFARNGQFDLAPYPVTVSWFARMKNFGHGTRVEISAQDAIDVALNSAPAALTYATTDSGLPGVEPGVLLTVVAEQIGKESVTGRLVGINARQFTLAIQSAQCGELHVHFPRLGYRITRVKTSA